EPAQSSWESALKIIGMNPLALPPAEGMSGMVAPHQVYQSYVDALANEKQFAPALLVAERASAHIYRAALLQATKKNSEEDLKLPLPATLDQIQQVAGRLGVTIVEYMATGRGLVIWVIRSEGQILGHYEAIAADR